MQTANVTWEALRSLDSATFTGIYLALGTPLVHPSFILTIVNNSTVIVTVSINGTSDVDAVGIGATKEYKIDNERGLNSIPAGTQFFIKGAAGTGLVYLSSLYIIEA